MTYHYRLINWRLSTDYNYPFKELFYARQGKPWADTSLKFKISPGYNSHSLGVL